MKRILLSLSAVLALSSCIQDELLDSPSPSDGDSAVTFESYLGRDAVTRATVEDATTLMDKGFGVMGWYTGQDDYAEDYASDEYDYDFMINTKVSNADGTGWSYSPLKYWPNNEGDKLTFLAYAPYDAAYSAVSGVASTALSQTIDFTVAKEVKDQIDLLWSDNPENVNMLKPDIDSRVLFTFKHALSRIGFKVAAFVDDVRTEDGSASENLDAGTVINVKKVMLVNGTTTYNADNSVTPVGVFYTGGTLDLYNFTAADATATVPAAWDEKLPADVIDAQYFELTADEHFINTVTDGDGMNVFQLSGNDATTLQTLNAEDSYIMIIPQDFTNEFTDGYKVYIEYDVVTTGDNALGSSDASTVTNRILSDLALTTDFESGKAYNLNIYLGMTSVKFDVVVEDWVDGDPADTDEDLPANKDGESGEGDGSEELFAGAGTPEDPFKIYTAEQLLKVSQLVNSGNSTYQSASYIQMNDIDLSTVCGPTIGADGTAVNWFPIGRNESFDGVYDGGGYSVSNLYFFSGSEGRCGLFYQNNGTVRNVTVTECDITAADSFVGAVVGYNDGGTVVNCHSDNGVLRSSDQYLGGVVGMSSGVVIACSNTSTVNCTSSYMSSTGGIVGVSENNVLACFNSGSVSGMHTGVAGVVGLIGAENVNILSCYNTGTVTNSNSSSYYATGSIVGRNYNNNAGFKLESSYHADESNGTSSDDTSIEVNGSTVSWENAMASMNNAIAEWNEVEGNVQVEYRYAINSDPATSATQPLILVKQ